MSLQPDRHSEHDDDDVQDGDGRYKDWSQLGTFQKRKLVCDIETKLKLLADKKDTGIVISQHRCKYHQQVLNNVFLFLSLSCLAFFLNLCATGTHGPARELCMI